MPRGRGEHGQWTCAVPTPTSSQDREPAAAVIGPWLPFWGRGAPRGEGRSGRPLSSSGCQTGSGRAARSTVLSLWHRAADRIPCSSPSESDRSPPPFPAARTRPGLLALSDPSPNPPRPPPTRLPKRTPANLSRCPMRPHHPDTQRLPCPGPHLTRLHAEPSHTEVGVHLGAHTTLLSRPPPHRPPIDAASRTYVEWRPCRECTSRVSTGAAGAPA